MKYKKFSARLVLLLVTYGLLNLVVWNLFTKDVLANPKCSGGDLTRMGYIKSSMMCRNADNNLPRRHLETEQYTGQKIGVVTLGDSFSSGGGGGLNNFYQDYLASINNLDVLNILQYKKLDKVTTISLLNNNGYLDRIKPEHVLIQCSEKLCLNDLPEAIDFSRLIPESELEKYEKTGFDQKPPATVNHNPVKLDFFSEANY